MLVFRGFRGSARRVLPGTSARMIPGCPWDIQPENFLFGLFFVPDHSLRTPSDFHNTYSMCGRLEPANGYRQSNFEFPKDFVGV